MPSITYTVIVSEDGAKRWYVGDKLHNEDGPAVERLYGRNDEWWIDGKQITEREFNSLFRQDDPGFNLADYDDRWYHIGKLHREGSPAILLDEDTQE